ncbi:MAG: DUF1080 domain-containing protein [Prolixibacteraceae bacterium]|jgi:hypothetical protein|nr:DUF1080 domain-containing protein [Prolixibacteraceae bacterium]
MKITKEYLLVLLTSTLLISSINLFAQKPDKEQQNPATTETWEPFPEKVFPEGTGSLPSDAIVLFNGPNLNAWEDAKGGKARWPIIDGIAVVASDSGSIVTKRAFGDCQLHVEWRIAPDITGEGQFRGNSGIILQGRYEIQVLESFESQTYSNGQAGAIYKQHPPMVNASKKPGEWQTYDINFIAPRFNEKGNVVIPARVTVLYNGVFIHNNAEIWGTEAFVGMPQYGMHNLKEPLFIQNHSNNHKNPVQYKNIWIREL